MKPLRKACKRILSCALAALVLAGCAPLAPSQSVEMPPAGGWVEQEVMSLDAKSIDSKASLCRQENGELWLISPVRANANVSPQIYHSIDDGQTWQQAASGWSDPAALPEGVQAIQYAVTPDGVPWMLGFCRMWEIGAEAKRLYVWKQGGWQLLWEDDRYYGQSALCPLQDGRVVVQAMTTSGDFVARCVASDGSFDTWTMQGTYLLTDGVRRVEWYTADTQWYLDDSRMEPMGGTPLLVQDNALYIWKDSGIQVRNLDGAVWEELLPPEESPALQLPGVQPVCLAETEEGTLLVAARQPDGGIRLLRYRYDPTLARGAEVVRVYSLYDNYAVRYAVAEYLREHPGAQVRYQTEFTQKASREEVKAAAERLLQQLESGEAPDLLVLDGMLWDLPLQELSADGVFCDLSGALQGKDLLPAARMGQEDAVFTAACRVEMPTLWIPREMQPPEDLDDFAQMVEAGPRCSAQEGNALYQSMEELPVWLADPVSSAMLLYMASRPSLVQDGEPDTIAMGGMLYKVQRLVVLDDPSAVWTMSDWDYWSSWLQGIGRAGDMPSPEFSRTALSSGTRMSTEEIFLNFDQPMQPYHLPTLSGKAVYFPRQIVAAPASGSTAAARELVSLLLDAPIQGRTDLGDFESGMPVNRTGLKDFCAGMQESVGQYWGHLEDTGEMQALCELLETADTPVYSDTPLDEPAARAVMQVLLGQSSHDALGQMVYEITQLVESEKQE